MCVWDGGEGEQEKNGRRWGVLVKKQGLGWGVGGWKGQEI